MVKTKQKLLMRVTLWTVLILLVVSFAACSKDTGNAGESASAAVEKQEEEASANAPGDWSSIMTLPTEEQLGEVKDTRSPYIVFYPEFGLDDGCTAYAMDLRMDFQPPATYIAPVNWYFDTASLEKQYARVWSDYGAGVGGYCGFQVLDNGTHAVIMTLWNAFCEDESGEVTVIKPTVLYPENAHNSNVENDIEGSYTQSIYEYDWKAETDYRLLLEQSDSEDGTAIITLWLTDLDKQEKTKLFCFDSKLPDVCMTTICGFVENFNPETAAYPRSLRFWNVRGLMNRSGEWENIKAVDYTVNNSIGDELKYSGSYNFGADADSCWIITSGVEGLCAPPYESGPYDIPATESGRP